MDLKEFIINYFRDDKLFESDENEKKYREYRFLPLYKELRLSSEYKVHKILTTDYVIEYDKNGNIYSEKHIRNGKVSELRRVEYFDDNNLIIDVDTFYGVFTETVFKYSDSGLLNRTIYRNHEKKDEVYIISFFDKNGHKKRTLINKDWAQTIKVYPVIESENLFKERLYTRNEYGLLTESIEYVNDGDNTMIYDKADYDFKNNKVIFKEIFYTIWGIELLQHIEFRFSVSKDNCFCVEKIDLSENDGGALLGNYMFFYEKNIFNQYMELQQSNIYCTNYDKKDSSFDYYRSPVFIHDYTYTNEHIYEKYRYHYDKYGNWINRSLYVNGHKKKEWKRRILYF